LREISPVALSSSPAAPASRVQIPPPFKFGSNEFGVKGEIYDYDESLKRYRRIIAGFGRNGELPSGTWISSPVGDDITETNNMIEYGKGLVGQKNRLFFNGDRAAK